MDIYPRGEVASFPFFVDPNGKDAPSNIKHKIHLRIMGRYVRDFGTPVIRQHWSSEDFQSKDFVFEH